MGAWFNELKYRLRLLFKRRQLEKDLQDELAFHIAMREERLQQFNDSDPHKSARVRFGNVGKVQEECRDIWIFGTIERLVADVRYAGRSLRKTPTFTLVAVVSLALGIGATTGIFSVFNHLLLRVLPVEEPLRLVNLSSPGPESGSRSCNFSGPCDAVFSYPMFRDLERTQAVFTGIAAHVVFGANLAYHGQTISGQGSLVSGSYFPVLGKTPALGRLLDTQDDHAVGQSPVAVLSNAYWKAHLGSSPSVLNDTLIVNGQVLTIVGVAPEGFEGTTFGVRPDVYVPITMSRLLNVQTNAFEDDRRTYWIYLFARLKPGVSMGQAREGINVPYHAILNDLEAPLQTELTPATLERFRARRLTIENGEHGQSMIRKIETPLTFLLGVTGLVLLIACANIANLLLARSAARSREMTIRLSIGAGRARLIAQLLTEALLLALLGGSLGLLVARWTVDLLAFITPDPSEAVNLPVGLAPDVLLFAGIVTVGTAILFGLFPALESTRLPASSVLKGVASGSVGAHSTARFRSGLAISQIALSLVLLFAAGLFTRSLFNVSKVDLGVKTDHLIVFRVSPSQNGYAPLQSREFFVRLEEDLRKLPGASAVTASMLSLFGGGTSGRTVAVEGFSAPPEADVTSRYNEIGPGYFSAVGVPMIAGREFTESDIAGRPKVAIVNERFVEKFHLGPNPIGKHVSENGGHSVPDAEIVGLVKDSKYADVKGAIPPVLFRPYRQDETVGSLTFYVRVVADPDKVLAIVQPTIAHIDPSLPADYLSTMDQQVSNNVAGDRILGVLSGTFAGLATLLAAVGLYGVMAYTVAQRTREFGVRMALGADPSQVLALVLRQVGWMTVIGAGIGLVGAVGVGQAAQSLLFELNGHDPAVLIASTILLTAIALAAGLVPAYRASKVDPMRALRHE